MNMNPTKTTTGIADQEDQRGRLRARWGDVLGGGFVLVPNVLLQHQCTMKLDCEEIVLLANLLLHWRADDAPPFPRSETLAQRTGLSRRTVQRRLKQLEEKGFLRRYPGEITEPDQRAMTYYDMQGIVEKLEPLGKRAREEREAFSKLRNDQTGHRGPVGHPAQSSAV